MELTMMNLPFRRNAMPDAPPPPIPTATVQRPLSRKAQDAIEQHYVEVAALTEERDRAKADYDKAMELCTKAKHTIQGLQDELADIKGRMTAYQLERDEAVAKYAKLEGLFVSIQAQLRAFEIPKAPAVLVAPDAEATNVPPTHDDMRKLVARINARD
jgi:hypothetical protein